MLALALLCVINNLCVAVQRLKSVSVFIKMSFTIFTASPRDLLPLLARDRGVFVFVKALTVKLTVQQVSASCRAQVSEPGPPMVTRLEVTHTTF